MNNVTYNRLSPNAGALDEGTTFKTSEAGGVHIQHVVSEFLSASSDAFGRLRVSAPTTLFESTFRYDLPPLPGRLLPARLLRMRFTLHPARP